MSDETIDISGLNKAAVLAALFNHSKQQGLGFLHTRGAHGMTEEQAAEELKQAPRASFDYLHGRVMKVSLDSDQLDPWLYDRDNGQGAAARAIASIRK